MSRRERAAYDFTVAHKMPLLSPTTQANMFALFLTGVDCLEIARLNKGISLGQIQVARVEGNWDQKRQEHIENLLRETRLRVQQTTLESVDFITTQLAATHKFYGDDVKKAIQTGNREDLGVFAIHGWRAYREAVDLLKTVTGQDAVKVKGEVHHTHEQVPAANRSATPEEARNIIKGALKRVK